MKNIFKFIYILICFLFCISSVNAAESIFFNNDINGPHIEISDVQKQHGTEISTPINSGEIITNKTQENLFLSNSVNDLGQNTQSYFNNILKHESKINQNNKILSFYLENEILTRGP